MVVVVDVEVLNAAKSWLVTKAEHYDLAVSLLAGTGIGITTEGRPRMLRVEITA